MLATFGSDFYAGRPAVTVNNVGRGQAYYVASRNDERFMDDFFGSLARKLSLLRALPVTLPEGVTAQLRTDGARRFVFVMNFNPAPVTLGLDGVSCRRLLDGSPIGASLDLPAYGVEILEA